MPRIDDIFNYTPVEKSVEIDVELVKDDKKLIDKRYDLFKLDELLDDLSELAQDSLTLDISFNGQQVITLTAKDIEEVNNSLNANKHDIYHKIGYVDVQLIHNDTEEMVSFMLNLNNFMNLKDQLKENGEEIYEVYTKDLKQKQQFYGEGSTGTAIGIPIVDILTGNFIATEDGICIADEFGNVVSF